MHMSCCVLLTNVGYFEGPIPRTASGVDGSDEAAGCEAAYGPSVCYIDITLESLKGCSDGEADEGHVYEEG